MWMQGEDIPGSGDTRTKGKETVGVGVCRLSSEGLTVAIK